MQGNFEMASVTDSLAEIMKLDGAMAAMVVDSGSGMILGQAGGGLDLDLAAAGNTEVIRAKLRTMNSLGIKGGIEDILITLANQFHIITPLTKNPELFIYVVLDKAKANLALARHKVRAVQAELAV